MTIEIHQPELEALILQRMATGRFQSVEEAVLAAFRSSPAEEVLPAPDAPKKNLTQFLKESPSGVQGLKIRSEPTREPVLPS